MKNKLALAKSKNLLTITKKILENKSTSNFEDENWIDRLLKWADDNHVSDLKWREVRECWIGFPRDKEKLLNSTELYLGNTILDFSTTCINNLPEEIGYLTNIEKLHLNNNKINKLPKQIGNLKKLTALYLNANNSLHEIPNTISNLDCLERLDLYNNDLYTLPKEIIYLKKLNFLNLSNNINLVLSASQIEWINKLKRNNDNNIYVDDYILNDNLNNRVWKDPDTSLIWQAVGKQQTYSWDEAHTFAKELNNGNFGGYNDWRVPNFEELSTIVLNQKYVHDSEPTWFINESLFNKNISSYGIIAFSEYWSSSHYYSSASAKYNEGLMVSFYSGKFSKFLKSNKFYVRCVRGEISSHFDIKNHVDNLNIPQFILNNICNYND